MLVLADEAMHGYQIMQAINDRTSGAWRLSPGAVYPTIAQLADEGLVITEKDGGRRLVTITPKGRTYLTERSAQLGDPFAGFAGAAHGPDLREPMRAVDGAARQIALDGDPAEVEAAGRVLAEARRALYLILAGDVDGSD
jgi:DNA-binding PadR family transcriptional regulator